MGFNGINGINHQLNVEWWDNNGFEEKWDIAGLKMGLILGL